MEPKQTTIMNKFYEVTDIGNRTYLINEHLSTMFVLLGEKQALVIDCGTGIGDFKGVVDQLTEGLPYKVAMTHSHVDHIGGRRQFSDVYVSTTDIPYIHEVSTLYRKVYADANALMGNDVKGRKILPTRHEPAVHSIEEGTVFDLGGRTIRVVATPGHTVGSVSYLDETNHTIYIGDVSNDLIFMWLPHCTTIDGMIETMEKLDTTEGFDTVWASHHTQPYTRDDLRTFMAGARNLAKKKNHVLPFIKVFDQDGNKIIYRTGHVH